MSTKTSTSRAQLHARRTRQPMGGLSLIELLVGMAMSLMAIVAIYQVLSVWDGRRRSITAGSSAQISGSIGIGEVERDLQLSGVGFGNINAATLGCTVSAYNSTLPTTGFTFTFAPIQIVDGASGAPDVVRVLYGNSAFVVNIQKVNSSTSTTKTLQYRTGFNAGDLVVVAGNTPRDCSLLEVTGNALADAVTIEHGTASYTSFYGGASVTPTMNSGVAGVAYPDGGEIYNLGPGAQLTQWQVTTAGVLTRTNLLRDTTATEVTEGVANLQAQYGLDTNADGKVDTWQDTPPAPSAAPDWTKVLAVRIAVLARSGQLEKDNVTPTAPSWAGGPFTMLNLDGSAGTSTPAAIANDWHHYRYRVYETMVPLRNMIWGKTS